MNSKSILFLLIFISSTSSLWAQKKKKEHYVGAGVLAIENFYKGNLKGGYSGDYYISPFPYIKLEWGRFKIDTKAAYFNLINTWFLGLSAVAQYKGEKYRGETIAEKDRSIFAGALLRLIVFQVGVTKDVQNESNGTIGITGIRYKFNIGEKQWRLSFAAIVEHWDTKYVNYYFGVKAHEATDSIPEYVAGNATNWRYSISPRRYLTDNLILNVGANVLYFDETVYNSPIVEKSKIWTYTVGLKYILD